MSEQSTDEDLKMAELLCSRLAHDLISPVGAVGNGLEILEDDPDPAMQKEAAGLIRLSANEASSRLQMLRLAFGALGGADQVALGDARNVVEAFVKERRINLNWQLEDGPAPARQVKLLATMAVLAVEALSRGGEVQVTGGVDAGFVIMASGRRLRLPEDIDNALSGNGGDMTPHNVPAFYAMRLAGHLGQKLSHRLDDDGLCLESKA